MPYTAFLRTYLQIYPGSIWDDYTELYWHFNPECNAKAASLLKRNMPNITSRTTKYCDMLKNVYIFIRGQYRKLPQKCWTPFPFPEISCNSLRANLPAIWRYTAELLKALSSKQLMKCQNLWPYARYLVYDDAEVLHTKEQAPRKYLHNDNVTYSCDAPGCDSGVAKDSRLGLECNAVLLSKHVANLSKALPSKTWVSIYPARRLVTSQAWIWKYTRRPCTNWNIRVLHVQYGPPRTAFGIAIWHT
jgi:hypothetical protein